MLAIFDERTGVDPSERSCDLISMFPWNRGYLLKGNYIDAMALFRRSTLLTLGGYDTTLALEGEQGWEDYDMWLHYLDEGLEPTFVPNIIGKYRRHGASMMDRHRDHESLVLPLLKRKYPALW